uniref:UBX domain-containing protein n=1 Tax=Aotus nancymaae TaxID=37293 RepID=A0A2K5DTY0_AOTNA
MAAEQQEVLRESVVATGSVGWDLQMALVSFYEDGGDEDITTISQATPSSVSRGTAPSDNKVTSFRDLIHDQDEEEEEGQRFYAGGSERSGQQIVGPPRRKVPMSWWMISLNVPKKHLQEVATPEEESACVAGKKRQHSSQDVHSGFSLDNGELRSCQDPSSAQFLGSIHRGEVPAEVNLDMEDHWDKDSVKSKGAFKVFTGEGQKVGSPAPTSSPDQPAENKAKASSSVLIVQSEPTTNIQIWLADGGRLVQKLNHSHKITMAATSFILRTTFLNKELVDESQTLKEATLLNAVIMHQ